MSETNPQEMPISQLTLEEKQLHILADFKRVSTVRLLFQGCAIEDLRDYYERFTQYMAEREEQEKQLQKRRAEKEAKAREILADMEEKDIDLSFLADVADTPLSGRSARNYKYEKDGKRWTGVGRRPEEFKNLTGTQLERYRIKHQ